MPQTPQPRERSAFSARTLRNDDSLARRKKNACPKARGLVNLASAGLLNFGFAVLEHLDRFAQLLIRLRRLGLVLLGGRVRVLVLVWSYGVVVAVCHQNVRRNRRVLNSLPTRRVVFRNRENQGGPIGQIDQFLHRTVAEGLIADNVAARILENRSRHDLRRSGGTPVYKNDNWQIRDRFRRFRRKRFPRVLLTLQVGDSPVIQEQVGGGDAFRLFAFAVVAQIKDEFLRTLLLQSFDLVGDLLRLALGEGVRFDVADAVVHHLIGYRRDRNDVSRDDDLLRFRAARTDDRNRNSRSRLAREQGADFRQRHLARTVSFDRFKDVRSFNADLVRRSARDHRDHGGVAETLRNRGADIGLRVGLLRLVILIFLRAQIARIRIERLQQTMQSAVRYLGDVGFLDVLAVHAREHFAVDLQLAVSAVVGRGAYATQSTHDHEQQNGKRRDEDRSFGFH